jgi:hypothetical protein
MVITPNSYLTFFFLQADPWDLWFLFMVVIGCALVAMIFHIWLEVPLLRIGLSPYQATH